jgi:hypothetical protein
VLAPPRPTPTPRGPAPAPPHLCLAAELVNGLVTLREGEAVPASGVVGRDTAGPPVLRGHTIAPGVRVWWVGKRLTIFTKQRS